MSTQNYDSTVDTLQHIKEVNGLLLMCINDLNLRAYQHDESKLRAPEKEIFDQYTPILKTLPYGSDEYKENLKKLSVALDHHYKHNSHHPQYYKNGINGMDLGDLVEMFCDWVAAIKRTKDGSWSQSMSVNGPRFNMSQQLIDIFNNTARNMCIIEDEN